MRDSPLSLLFHVLSQTHTFFNILAFVGICSQWCFVSALRIDLDPSTVSPGQHVNLHWTLQSGDDPTAVYQLFVDTEQDMGLRMTLNPEGKAAGTMEWVLPNLSNGPHTLKTLNVHTDDSRGSTNFTIIDSPAEINNNANDTPNLSSPGSNQTTGTIIFRSLSKASRTTNLKANTSSHSQSSSDLSSISESTSSSSTTSSGAPDITISASNSVGSIASGHVLDLKMIIGIAVGGGAVLVFCLILLVICLRRSPRRHRVDGDTNPSEPKTGPKSPISPVYHVTADPFASTSTVALQVHEKTAPATVPFPSQREPSLSMLPIPSPSPPPQPRARNYSFPTKAWTTAEQSTIPRRSYDAAIVRTPSAKYILTERQRRLQQQLDEVSNQIRSLENIVNGHVRNLPRPSTDSAHVLSTEQAREEIKRLLVESTGLKQLQQTQWAKGLTDVPPQELSSEYIT